MFKAQWKQIVDPIKRIEKVKAALRRKIIRKAVTAGSKLVVQGVKAFAPKKSGALKASIGRKISVRKNGLKATAIIGARRSYSKTVGKKLLQPFRYIGPLESGGKHSSPHSFLKPALQSYTDVYLNKVRETVASELDKELAK